MQITPRQLKIDPARCTGCGCCVSACALIHFSLTISGFRKFAVIPSQDLCSGCLKCVMECRVGAIISTEGALV